MGETSENLRNSWVCLWMFSLRQVVSWFSILRHTLDANIASPQITEQLEPLDILQLSRVSQHFRSTFASKHSRHIWVAARRNISMPECPSDLTELQYASLMFEQTCQVRYFSLLLMPVQKYFHMDWFRHAALEHTRSTILSGSDFVAHVSKQSEYLCQQSTSGTDLSAA